MLKACIESHAWLLRLGCKDSSNRQHEECSNGQSVISIECGFFSDKFCPFLQENWGTLLFSSVNGWWATWKNNLCQGSIALGEYPTPNLWGFSASETDQVTPLWKCTKFCFNHISILKLLQRRLISRLCFWNGHKICSLSSLVNTTADFMAG